MLKATIAAVAAIMATDVTLTPAEIAEWKSRLAGRVREAAPEAPAAVSVEAAAKRLGVSKRTVFALVKEGRLMPFTLPGRKIIKGITADSVNALVAACTSPAPAATTKEA